MIGLTSNSAVKSRHTAAMAKMVYGQEMMPCPKCGSYHLGYSVPIKLDAPLPDAAKDILKMWARATRDGHTPLKGTEGMVCRECHHRGPTVDVTGMTSEEVCKSVEIAKEIKRLWNGQQNPSRQTSAARKEP